MSQLLDITKSHRREFYPVWCFPVVFYIERGISASLDWPNLLFWFVSVPFLYWSLSRALAVGTEREIHPLNLLFLCGMAPLFIWGALVYLGIWFGW